MGCLGALVGLAMAIGGGYFWYTTSDFVWAGIVCVVGILILLVYAIVMGLGGEAIDIGTDFF